MKSKPPPTSLFGSTPLGSKLIGIFKHIDKGASYYVWMHIKVYLALQYNSLFAVKPGLPVSRKDRKHRLRTCFLSFPAMAWSLYGSNDHRH